MSNYTTEQLEYTMNAITSNTETLNAQRQQLLELADTVQSVLNTMNGEGVAQLTDQELKLLARAHGNSLDSAEAKVIDDHIASMPASDSSGS